MTQSQAEQINEMLATADPSIPRTGSTGLQQAGMEYGPPGTTINFDPTINVDVPEFVQPPNKPYPGAPDPDPVPDEPFVPPGDKPFPGAPDPAPEPDPPFVPPGDKPFPGAPDPAPEPDPPFVPPPMIPGPGFPPDPAPDPDPPFVPPPPEPSPDIIFPGPGPGFYPGPGGVPRTDLQNPASTLAASLDSGRGTPDWLPVPYEPTGGIEYVHHTFGDLGDYAGTRNPLGLGEAAGEATRMLRDTAPPPEPDVLYAVPDPYYDHTTGLSTPPGVQPDFATDVLTGLGAPVTDENLATIAMWQHMEGQSDQGQGMTGAAAENNPLATTWGRSQGYDPYNYDAAGDPLVWNYPDYATGVQNTINTLNMGYYDPLVQGLQQGLDAATLNLMPGVQDALGTWSNQGYTGFANAGTPGWAAGMNPADLSSGDALAQALAASIFG
jgi:hypothetical protein